tara:strand:+ start:35 stop:826 length:792 start_codon:yes stop_codon:yes gene_type:complete
MLRSRIIPCLLIHKNGLVKTKQFDKPKYVGDPINAVKIFNEKEVDEIIILDIDKTAKNEKPNFDLIQKLANECRMPFCYGGGINSLSDALRIISLGVEKVAISSAAISNPDLLDEIANVIGSQSVVVVIDVKKNIFSKYLVYTNNGKNNTGIKLKEFLFSLKERNIGEVVINSINNDGVMKGYDYDLVKIVRNIIDIPITVIGGAGSLDDVGKLISKFKIIGAGAGNIFVFKGKYKAVLINYPNLEQRNKLYYETNNTRSKVR